MEKLKQELFALVGLRLSARQEAALRCYETELLDWNNRFNLTAIRDAESIRAKHFLDSMSCLLAMRDRPVNSMVDIGTGAGFPGLPLKIVFPNMRLTLVESVGKKAEFCRHIVEKLGLSGVDVLQTRAEDLGQLTVHREKYDWAVARAVANLPVLAEFLLPLVHIGGCMLAQKGESGPAEAHLSETAIRILGGRIRQLMPVTIPGVVEERYLILVDKVAATPPQYPRRVGIPAKKPLGGSKPLPEKDS